MQGIIRVQLQLVEAEAVGQGHRVGPGDIAVETDPDKGETVQRCARDIVGSGQRQVGLVPGAGTKPGLVGVAQQHATAVPGGVPTQGQAVAAAIQVPERGRRRGQGRGVLFQTGGRSVAGAVIGAGGGQNRAAENALLGAAAQGLPAQEEEQVNAVERSYPFRVAATEVALGQPVDTGLLKVAVHAAGIPFSEVAGELRQGGNKFLGEGLLVAVEKAKQEVRLHAAQILAHQLRGTPGGKHDLPHRHTEIVLGIGVAEAVTEAAPVVRLDMRDAVLGAPHFRGVGERGLGLGRCRWGQVTGVGAGNERQPQRQSEQIAGSHGKPLVMVRW